MRPITVVIPALNEVKKLPGNVSALLASDVIEQVVVVDGGSTDGTGESLTDHPRLSIERTKSGRALQMNHGARQANTEWILFHHADSELSVEAIGAIADLGTTHLWGGFTHQFSPNNWKLKIVSRLHNFRWRRTGVVYGDQSMFVRRAFFEHIGGFREGTIEDLDFSDRALQHAPSVLLPHHVLTDSRKFTQIGEFRALFQVFVILRQYERNREVGVARFFEPYR